MTWEYTDEYYKQYTRETWNESASYYEAVQRNTDLWNPPLLKAASPRPGQHVLDLATGLGEPAISLARAVGPEGGVLGVDLAEEMIAHATERAKRAGVENLRLEIMDAEALELDDASMDLVTSRFGIQIFTNPEKALEEAVRVLRPGGRLAATVWVSPGERSPAIDIFIAPMLTFAEPDETGYLPTPYEMGGPGELRELFEAAGLTKVTEATHRDTWTYKDTDEFYEATLKGTPIGHSLWEEDEDVQASVMKTVEEELPVYVQADGSVRLPAEALVVAGHKP